jgi:hypothetical protein
MTFKLTSMGKLISAPVLLAILAATISFLLTKNWLDQATASFISTLVGILFGAGGANVTTFNHLADKVDNANGVVR